MRLLLLTLISLPLLVTAQTKVPTNVQIHVAGQEPLGYAPCEPSIAIDPTTSVDALSAIRHIPTGADQ